MPPVGKRSEILDAAVLMFSQKGVDTVSVREVAERAGVSTANVFYHFGSKEILFKAALEAVSDTIVARRTRVLELDVDDASKLKAIVADMAAAHLAHPAVRKMLLRGLLDEDPIAFAQFARPEYSDQYHGLAKLVERVVPARDPYQLVFIFMMLGLAYPSFMPFFDAIRPLRPEERNPEKLAESVLAVIIPDIDWSRVGIPEA